MLMVFGLMFGMFPQVADEEFRQRADEMAADPDCDPTVRAAILIGVDTLARRETGPRRLTRPQATPRRDPRGSRPGWGCRRPG